MPADSGNARELISIRPAKGFQIPTLVAEVGPEATKRFFEFFTVPIRNKNTRIAYYQAIRQFLDWCDRCGFRHLEDIEPITVAADIEQHAGSPATIKQHMAAILMMFSWMTEKGILAMNPAREVKTPKFSRSEGKTPARPTEDVLSCGRHKENGGNLEVAQRIAGHADSRTTKLYDRRGQKVLLEDMERIRY